MKIVSQKGERSRQDEEDMSGSIVKGKVRVWVAFSR
jgi:hypothetical protein